MIPRGEYDCVLRCPSIKAGVGPVNKNQVCFLLLDYDQLYYIAEMSTETFPVIPIMFCCIYTKDVGDCV